MNTTQTQSQSVLDQILEPLSQCFNVESARRLVDFDFTPEVQQRVEYLAGQCNEGLLTPEERLEYEAIVSADDFISILASKARRYLIAHDLP